MTAIKINIKATTMLQKTLSICVTFILVISSFGFSQSLPPYYPQGTWYTNEAEITMITVRRVSGDAPNNSTYRVTYWHKDLTQEKLDFKYGNVQGEYYCFFTRNGEKIFRSLTIYKESANRIDETEINQTCSTCERKSYKWKKKT